MLLRRFLCAATLSLLIGGSATQAQRHDRARPGESAGQTYAFAYFTNDDNGAAGMRLAISDDGYRYTAVRRGAPIVAPQVGTQRLIRDPSIARDPRTGLYHMVWTTGWAEASIGHASSKDLIHWSPQQPIYLMTGFADVKNAWAPELSWDRKKRRFRILWASALGRTGRQSIYCATTRDFTTFSRTQRFYDPGFDVIDATLLEHDGRTMMFVKDERMKPLRKLIQWTDATRAPSAFGPLSEPLTPSWSEGPTAVDVGGDIVLFYDRYFRHRYGAALSADHGHSWQDISDRIAMPEHASHGTIIPIDRRTYDWLAGQR